MRLDAWPEVKLAAETQLGETEARKEKAVPGLREMLMALPEVRAPWRAERACARRDWSLAQCAAFGMRLTTAAGASPQEKRPRDMGDAALLRALRARKFRVDDTCAAPTAHATPTLARNLLLC